MQQSPLAEEGVGISTVTSQGDVNLDGEPWEFSSSPQVT